MRTVLAYEWLFSTAKVATVENPMFRAALIMTAAFLLFVLPSTASAHGGMFHAQPSVAHAAIAGDCYLGVGEAGTIPSDMHVDGGPCCGLASCSPVTLAPMNLVGPASAAGTALPMAMAAAPPNPVFAVFAPPG